MSSASSLLLVALTTVASCVLLASLPLACSSGSDNRPPGLDTSGAGAGSTSLASGGNTGANGGSNTAGDSSMAGESTGADGPSDNGGDVGTGRPTPGPSVCNETASWVGATPVSGVSTGAGETLLSITSDELDLAFLRAGALYVAHRAQATGNFAPGVPITLPSGWSATQGAALSADGKRLILVSADQTLLGELTRATRDEAFSGAVDQSAYATVNQNAVETGDIYASPTVSPDDLELFFNSAFQGGASTVVVSTRSAGQVWSSPTRVSSELDGQDTARCLPTGVSADERTLFYFNEMSMMQEARWRDEPDLTSPLYDMVDLGARRGAQPNAACDHLYSDTATDVVVEHD
jgi:hypothetical protein